MVVWMDGCDHYIDDSHIQRKWGYFSGTTFYHPNKGVNGGGAISSFGNNFELTRICSYTEKMTAGFWAFYPSRPGETLVFQNIFAMFLRANVNKFCDFTLSYGSSGALVASSSSTSTTSLFNNLGSIELDEWHHWEFQIEFLNSSLERCSIWRDGILVYARVGSTATYAGATQPAICSVRLGSHNVGSTIVPSSKSEYYDDIYIIDVNGLPDTNIGPSYIDTHYAETATGENQMTVVGPLSRTGTIKDGSYDTAYLSTEEESFESFKIKRPPSNPYTIAVQFNILARKTGTDKFSVRQYMRRKGVERTNFSVALSTDWINYRYLQNAEPYLSNLWNIHSLSESEFGFEVVK